MFWFTDAEVPGDGLSASMTRGHTSSRSLSTHLLCLRDHSHSHQTRWASRLTASLGNETPCGVLRERMRSCTRILMLRSKGWYKPPRAIPDKLIQRYSPLSLKGDGPNLRFGLIPGAGDPRTRVFISVLLNSMDEGQMGQLGHGNIRTVSSHCQSS
jgi:hypothetical protein